MINKVRDIYRFISQLLATFWLRALINQGLILQSFSIVNPYKSPSSSPTIFYKSLSQSTSKQISMHIEPLLLPKMSTLHINSQENSDKPNKIKGISSWAFLFSIFIYISIFYIFNLSPSYLFSTTKFWFFISNTLILIIAADFGAFFSSKEDDFYEEYVKKSRARNFPSFELQYSKIEEKKYPQQVVDQSQQEEIIKDVVVIHKSDESAKNKMEIAVKSDLGKEPNDNLQENSYDILEVASKVDHNEKTCQENEKELRRVRSLSDRAIEIKDNEKRIVLQRSNTENHDYNNYGEENEFSSMSNEELNKRVEEFIRRFNRQIRLQAVDRRLNEV